MRSMVYEKAQATRNPQIDLLPEPIFSNRIVLISTEQSDRLRR